MCCTCNTSLKLMLWSSVMTVTLLVSFAVHVRAVLIEMMTGWLWWHESTVDVACVDAVMFSVHMSKYWCRDVHLFMHWCCVFSCRPINGCLSDRLSAWLQLKLMCMKDSVLEWWQKIRNKKKSRSSQMTMKTIQVCPSCPYIAATVIRNSMQVQPFNLFSLWNHAIAQKTQQHVFC